MPELAVAAIGVATSLAGSYVQYQGQEKAAAASQAAETQRQQQLTLDATRQRRDIARQAIVARSSALSNATNQGAGFGMSSGLQGGYGQINNQAVSGTLFSGQNQQIGNNIFADNRMITQGQTEAMTGQGISSFGSLLMNNFQTIGKVGGYLTGQEGWGASPVFNKGQGFRISPN